MTLLEAWVVPTEQEWIDEQALQELRSALCPLLDAGLDLGEAFNWAVLWGNVDAAKICLERGADPTNALRKQRAREAVLDAERNGSTEMANQQPGDERLPRGEISPEMENFLRSILVNESLCE
jgi:hypothetical protein